MRLWSEGGDSLEITPLRCSYNESPISAAPQGIDADILSVRLAARIADGRQWAATEPFLLAGDLGVIARWLRAVVAGEGPGRLEFFEPCLSFELSDGHVRVWLELEARPPWAPAEGAPMEDLWIAFPIDATMLLQAASEAEADDQKFPVRSASGRGAPGGGGITMR